MFNLKNLRTFFARNKFSLLEKESTQFLCNIAIDLGQMFLSREVSTMNTKNEKDTACNITLHRSLDFFFFFSTCYGEQNCSSLEHLRVVLVVL